MFSSEERRTCSKNDLKASAAIEKSSAMYLSFSFFSERAEQKRDSFSSKVDSSADRYAVFSSSNAISNLVFNAILLL